MPRIAVDVGNSRIKIGLFPALGEDESASGTTLATPARALSMAADFDSQKLRDWVADVPSSTPWWIASVNRPTAARLIEWINQRGPASSPPSATAVPAARLLSHIDLPIIAAVEHPDRVGIDRLAGAVAANRLREPARPAIIVDVGSAITVDLVTADGVFRGGAILPGIGMSARALDDFTDLLPRSPLEELTGPPPALGTSTLAAIHSGLYWGAVGAMRELIARLSATLQTPNVKPIVFLTGGAASSIAELLDPTARYVEHLVLSGIALARPIAGSQKSDAI